MRANRPTELEALSALRTLAAFLAPEHTAATEPERYANLHEHGAGCYRRALRAIAAGELPAFEVARGKRLVRVEDWRRWLERDRVKPSSASPEPEPEAVDEIAEIVSINARRRRRTGA